MPTLEKAKLKEDALLRKITLIENKTASKKQKLTHQPNFTINWTAANNTASKKQNLAHQSTYNSDDNDNDYNDENNTSDNDDDDDDDDTSDNDFNSDDNNRVMSWYNPNEIYLDANEEMIRKPQENEREEIIRKAQEEKREVAERILMAEQERIQKDHDQKTREADYFSKEEHACSILYSTDCASNQFNEVWTEFKDHYYV